MRWLAWHRDGRTVHFGSPIRCHVTWHLAWLSEHLSKLGISINCNRMWIYSHLKASNFFLKFPTLQIIWEQKVALCVLQWYVLHRPGEAMAKWHVHLSLLQSVYCCGARRKQFTLHGAGHQLQCIRMRWAQWNTDVVGGSVHKRRGNSFV